MTIPKVTKDGKVAVIVSDGYGIGFSTSMSSGPAEGCLEGLYIEWIPEGVAFRIDQTDGAEYIVRADELPYVA